MMKEDVPQLEEQSLPKVNANKNMANGVLSEIVDKAQKVGRIP